MQEHGEDEVHHRPRAGTVAMLEDKKVVSRDLLRSQGELFGAAGILRQELQVLPISRVLFTSAVCESKGRLMTRKAMTLSAMIVQVAHGMPFGFGESEMGRNKGFLLVGELPWWSGHRA